MWSIRESGRLGACTHLRGRLAYKAGHIPDAIFLDLDEDLSGEDAY